MRPDTDTLWLVADLPSGGRLVQPCADEQALWRSLAALAPVVPVEATWSVTDKAWR